MVIPSSRSYIGFEAEDKTDKLELADLSETKKQTAELLTSNSSQLPKVETCCKGRKKLSAIVFGIIITLVFLAGLAVFIYIGIPRSGNRFLFTKYIYFVW